MQPSYRDLAGVIHETAYVIETTRLTEEDVTALLDLKHWTAMDHQSDASWTSELRAREARLSHTAYRAWTEWPPRVLRNELKRWIPRYRVTRGPHGLYAYAWLPHVKRYSDIHCASRLSREEAQGFKQQLIRLED